MIILAIFNLKNELGLTLIMFVVSIKRTSQEGSSREFNMTGRIFSLIYDALNIFETDIAADIAKDLTCSYTLKHVNKTFLKIVMRITF